ncbi:MAG: hypothetical protein K0U78_12760, partial [Actinomycetia bacterium]|nr:hypothetical protein [Actinomycetes bacterium]
GYMICHRCLEMIKRKNYICPNCDANEFPYFKDFFVNSYVQDIVVICQHQDKGCEWEGKSIVYVDHLYLQCRFSETVCKECRDDVLTKKKRLDFRDYVEADNAVVCLDVRKCMEETNSPLDIVTGESDVFRIKNKFEFVLKYSWQGSNDFINIWIEPKNIPFGFPDADVNQRLKTYKVTATLKYQHNLKHNHLRVEMVCSENEMIQCTPNGLVTRNMVFYRKDKFIQLKFVSLHCKCNDPFHENCNQIYSLNFRLHFKDS